MGLKCLPSRCYGGWDAAYDRDSVHEFLPVCNIVRANRVTSSTVCSSRVAASSSSASSDTASPHPARQRVQFRYLINASNPKK